MAASKTSLISKFTFLFLVCLCPLVFAGNLNLPNDTDIYNTAKVTLAKKTGEYFHRTIRRTGDKTIEFEGFIQMQADYKTFQEVVMDYPHFRDWILHEINQKPNGGNYYVQILDMKVQPKDNGVLAGRFFLNFPAFKQPLEREFKTKAEASDLCTTLSLESIPKDGSVLDYAEGVIKIFKAETAKDFVWLYLKGKAKIRYWLLYEALPEKLMLRESGERIQKVLDNYTEEEIRRIKNKKKS